MNNFSLSERMLISYRRLPVIAAIPEFSSRAATDLLRKLLSIISQSWWTIKMYSPFAVLRPSLSVLPRPWFSEWVRILMLGSSAMEVLTISRDRSVLASSITMTSDDAKSCFMTELRQLCSPFSPFQTGMIMVAEGIVIFSPGQSLWGTKRLSLSSIQPRVTFGLLSSFGDYCSICQDRTYRLPTYLGFFHRMLDHNSIPKSLSANET